MPERKGTPDILGQVLEGKTETRQPTRQKASKPASPKAGKPAKRQARTPSRLASKARSESTKATFYLSPDALNALEASWLELRKMAGSTRGRVSKSALVEEALRQLHKSLSKPETAQEVLRVLTTKRLE